MKRTLALRLSILLVSLLAGCAMLPTPVPPTPSEDTPTAVPPTLTPISGPIPHPTGARDIVMQLNQGPGFIDPLTSLMLLFPDFTLYGDGDAIYVSESGYHQSHVDEVTIQRLLRQVAKEGQFFALEPDLSLPDGLFISDAGSTSLRVVADGQDRTVNAYALGEDRTDTPARHRLQAMEQAIRAIMKDDAPAYQPTAARLYVQEDDAGTWIPALPPDTPDPAIPAWPIDRVQLADATNGQLDESAVRLTGADAVAALETASAPRPFTQNGHTYEVVVVPDLP